MEPSSAATMRPVLTHGYSSSFSASSPHFSIISSPVCVCVWAFNCGWWLQVSTDESAWTQLLSLFRVLFSRSVRLSSGFTHHRSCHSRTGCPFRLDTIIHLCVCVCVAHACRKTSSRDLGQSEMWSAPPAAPSCSGSARLGERNSGNSVWLWAAEASSQQLPSIRGAQRCTGRERDPIRGQAERLESGQSYCPPLLTYTAPGLELHHTHPVFPPLPVYLAASIFLVILIVFFSSSLGRRWARQRKKKSFVRTTNLGHIFFIYLLIWQRLPMMWKFQGFLSHK